MNATGVPKTHERWSLSSPACQNLSLRELLTEKVVGSRSGTGKPAKKLLTTPVKKVSASSHSSSKRQVRKRASWSGSGEDEEDDKKESGTKKKKTTKRQAKKKEGEKKDPKKWNPEKHSVYIVGAESFDTERDVMIVDAKASTHHRAKTNRVQIGADDIDEVKQVYWSMMAIVFAELEMPVSFEATRFASANNKNKAKE